MKRGWKIFWLVCAICAGIGLVCCSIAFIMGVTIEAIENRFPNGIGIVSHRNDMDYDYDDYDNDDDYDGYNNDDDDYDGYNNDDDHSLHHEEDSHDIRHTAGSTAGVVTNTGSSKVISGTGSQSFTGVNAIDAYMCGGILEVASTASASDKIRIETENISEKLGLKCYMDGNELKLVTKKIAVKSKAGKVIIHIPQDYRLEEASLELLAGYLHIADISARELSVDVGAGEGIVENFTASEVELDCGAGSLTAAGSADMETDIDCGVGEISYTAAGRESDYNYDIDCGIGEIVCGERKYSGIGANKTINNNAARYMDISCGIGAVAVNFSEM